MRSFTLLLLFAIISNTSNAQDRGKIDSLKNVLMTLKEDTSKVFGLNEIAYEYISPNQILRLSCEPIVLRQHT